MTMITWTASAGGDWATGSDWTSVPGVGDDILITEPGIYTITASLAEAANSIVLDSAGATLLLSAPLDVAGLFNVNSGTVVFNGGAVSAGIFDLSGGLLTGATVDVSATNTVALSGGSIIANAATFADPSGTITLPQYGAAQSEDSGAPLPVDWSRTVTYAPFTPALGSLVSVAVGVTAWVAGSVAVTSQEADQTGVTVALPGSVTVSTPNSADVSLVTFDASAQGVVGAGSSVVLAPSAIASASDVYVPDAADLITFTGTAAVPLTLAASSRLVVTGPANMTIDASASAAAAASLQYGYAPVGLGSYYSENSSAGGGSQLGNQPSPVFFPGLTTAQQVFTFADQTTGWSTSFSPTQFDPALGTLEAVSITLTGDIQASVAAENEGNSAASVATAQTGAVNVTLPGGSTVTAAPSVSDSMTLAAFDGTADFAGPSGRTDQGLTQSATTGTSLTDVTDLAAFTGQGTVAAPIADIGSGTIDGPANLAAVLRAQGGATVTLDYAYIPATTATWVQTAGGDWGTGADWSLPQGVPTTADAVAITTAGTYTISESSAQSVRSVLVDSPDATLVLDAPLDVTYGFTLQAGTVVFDSGTLTAGVIDVNGGLVTGNTIDLIASGSIEFSNALVNAGPAGNISLTTPLVIIGADGTVAADTIDVFGYPSAASTTPFVTTGTLQVTPAAGVECFLSGTRIATPGGEVAVEALRVGDKVRLASGRTRRVVWTGHRTLSVADHPRPDAVRPIRIVAGAFQPNVPACDLLLSPDHAVFAEGVLIPVKYLVNGISILPDPTITRPTYWHVELDAHDVLLAEALPVESYLETGQRAAFVNSDGSFLLHPDFRPDHVSLIWEACAAAPLVVTGPVLTAVRAALSARLAVMERDRVAA